jgi:hypothetical protein
MAPPRRRKRASALIAALICIFLCTAIIGLVLDASTQIARDTVRVRRTSDAQRAAIGYTEYVAAVMRNELEKPGAPATPTAADFAAMLKMITDQPPSAGTLGVDASRYSLQLSAPSLGAIRTKTDFNLPTTRDPARQNLPGVGSRAALALSQAITCTLVLTDQSSGQVSRATATGDLVYVRNTFLQYGYYFNGFKPQISSGTQNKFKGGIFSNNPVRLATNDWGGIGWGASIQIDSVNAPHITLSSLEQARFGNVINYYNGIYISGGDLGYQAGSALARMDGKITYFANKDTPRLLPANPTSAGAAKSDFLPTFLTAADFDGAASDSDYFKNLHESGLTGRTTAGIIDSRHPDIKSLAGRYNGNFADANTGWQARYPDTLPKSMQQLPADKLAELGLVDTDPHAILEPPCRPTRTTPPAVHSPSKSTSKTAS